MPQKLGQHFLRDESVLFDIANEVSKFSGSLIVEIGSGTGVLTEAIITPDRDLVAIEWDDRLVGVLRRKFFAASNFHLINADIRKLDLISEIDSRFGRVPDFALVGNLPYYLTSFLLRQIFGTWRILPKEMVFLIQKEVAERIVAEPGSKNRSVLSVLTQAFSEPQIIRFVGPESFTPPPKVSSAIIRFDKIFSRLPDGIDDRQFFRIVKAGFGEKRKTVLNALSGGLNRSKEELKEILSDSGIDGGDRSEDLEQKSWYDLCKKIYLS